MLTMADCRRRIQLEFFLGTLRARRESLKKIDLLMKQLEQFRSALRTEASLIEQYEAKQKAKPRKSNKASKRRAIPMDEQTREAMRNNAITNIHGETPYATVEVTSREIRPRDRVILQQWAEKLGVSIDVLLKRILLAVIEDQLYGEKIPEI
jgi:hypothetical protein